MASGSVGTRTIRDGSLDARQLLSWRRLFLCLGLGSVVFAVAANL
jgi:hypothetical protein